MGKDFLKRWRTGCCHFSSAPSLSNWQCCLLQISSLQKHQTFPSSSFWRNKLCCSEAAEEYVIISCISFLPSLVHRSRMVHAHCLSHLGLFIYAGAHTASCSRASAQTCSFPSYLRSCSLKKDRDKVPSLYLFRIQFCKSCMCNSSWVMGLQHRAWTSQPIETQIEEIRVLLHHWLQRNRLRGFCGYFCGRREWNI